MRKPAASPQPKPGFLRRLFSSKSQPSALVSRLSSGSSDKFFIAPPEPPVFSATFMPPTRRKPFRARMDLGLVYDFKELLAALSAHKVQITLGEDIITPENIVIDYDVAINLNGFNIISEPTVADARVLDIRRGTVTLTGDGRIFAMGSRSAAVRVFGAMNPSIPDYTVLNIDESVHLYAPGGTGLLISPALGAAYGLKVNFAGEIVAETGICLSSAIRGLAGHEPEINILDGARITADESAGGAAVQADGFGHWYFGAAKLLGTHGVVASFGDLSFEHTKIASLASTVLSDPGSSGPISLSFRGGTYLSKNELTIVAYPGITRELTIDDGDFCGLLGVINQEIVDIITATSGNFSTDVETFMFEHFPDISLGEVILPAAPEPVITDITTWSGIPKEAYL